MAAGSLVVKIGANLDDFSSKLNKMTKEVRKASQLVTDIGTSMTIGITLPVALAMKALAGMGMENEAVGRKMERVFGAATARVNDELERMMAVVPEAGTELQKMAIDLTEVGEGLGLAAPQAALLSENLMKMAGQISAGKMVPFAEALESVEKALMGQTRGLKQLGIVIDQDQIKQEAYRLGLLKTGDALTPLGTALATYSLLTKQATRFTDEAGAQAEDTARQWDFLKRDFGEFLDQTSNLMVPALRALIAVGRGVVDFMNWLPMPVRAAAIAIAGFAAVVGPTLIVVAKLTEAVVALRAATTILAASGGFAKILALLANPEVIAGIAALTIAIVGVTAAWKHFHKETAKTELPDLGPLSDVTQLMAGLKDGATSSSTKSPLEQFQSDASKLAKGFELALARGEDVESLVRRIQEMNLRAINLYAQQADKLSDVALAAQEVASQMEALKALQLIGMNEGAFRGREILAASRGVASNQALRTQVFGEMRDEETALRLRELRLEIVRTGDGFNAARIASIEMEERFLDVSRTFRTGVQSFKQGWSNIGQSAMAGLEAGLSGVMASFGPFALAVQAIGAVMQGLQPFIDALFVPLAELGRIIGIMLTPTLKILMIPLRALGIVVSFVGEILARVAAGISTGIGRLLVGLGNLINKLPGSPGNGIKKAGEAMLAFASDQYEAADQLQRARKELQRMSFADAMGGVEDLGDAARQTAEELYNLPNAFKVNLEKWRAMNPINGDAPVPGVNYHPGSAGLGQPGSAGPYGGLPGGSRTALAINLDGRQIARVTWAQLRSEAVRQYGNASRVADVATF